MKQLFQRVFFILLVLSPMISTAQRPPIQVVGSVKDSLSGQPVPYATVAAVTLDSGKIISGTTTADDGSFRFTSKTPRIAIEVSFMGFEKKRVPISRPENGVINVGAIQLKEQAEALEGIEITAERSTMEFKLDKRVFNVGKDISTTGMGAMDVLDQVPSVSVNIEGEVSLRGNTGVQILINGKPSVLSDEGSNALGTITADMIERVEVITNPSAKYNAEGTSGIINIILKKEEKKGFNGSVSLNTGAPDNHSVGVSLNRRTEKFNLFTQFGAGYRSLPRYNNSRNQSLTDGSIIESDGVAYRNERFANITLGTDYHINNFNVITVSGSFAYEAEQQPSETSFEIYDSNQVLVSEYTRTETTEAANPKYQFDVQYEKEFKGKDDHKLLFSSSGRFFGKDQSSEFLNESNTFSDIASNQLTEADFYQQSFTYKLDYTNPITKKVTIETGAMYDLNDVGNDYAVFNENNIGEYVQDVSLTNNFEYDQKVLGIYGTGAYEGNKWGAKLGLRLENTDLKTVLTTTNQKNSQYYTNLFPSLHTSYKFTKVFSVQAGYSRRIFRPRMWDLNPFFNIQNNYNIRMGNPNLQPEFADSYEVSSIFVFKKGSLNASVYHLYTTDVVERISYFEDGVNITMPENIGVRNKTGVEVNGRYNATKWLTLRGEMNYGYFTRTGSFQSQNFDFTGDQYSARITSKMKLKAQFELEISGNYQSSVETVQGEVSGFAAANIGIRKKLWKGKAVINANVRDVFASRIRETTILQPTYSVYSFSQRGRFITLGFSYSFGKGEAMTYSGGRRR